MSAAAVVSAGSSDWARWRTQAWTIIRGELRKNFISRRGIWIYLLALAPAALVWTHSIVAMQRSQSRHDMTTDTTIMAALFQYFFLRPAMFFGCVGIFTYLFRGELVEKSLHYYFMAPVRREVLVISKYIAGAVTACFFFGGSILLTLAGMYAHFPTFAIREWLLNGPGLFQVFSYLSVTVLGCLAWGSVFVWMGIRWRNPIVPSVVFLMWESLNLFLPAVLRNFSILHYLQSLTPVEAPARGPGVILGRTADPVPVWIAVLCLAGITAFMLFLSARQLKRTEISYSTD